MRVLQLPPVIDIQDLSEMSNMKNDSPTSMRNQGWKLEGNRGTFSKFFFGFRRQFKHEEARNEHISIFQPVDFFALITNNNYQAKCFPISPAALVFLL